MFWKKLLCVCLQKQNQPLHTDPETGVWGHDSPWVSLAIGSPGETVLFWHKFPHQCTFWSCFNVIFMTKGLLRILSDLSCRGYSTPLCTQRKYRMEKVKFNRWVRKPLPTSCCPLAALQRQRQLRKYSLSRFIVATFLVSSTSDNPSPFIFSSIYCYMGWWCIWEFCIAMKRLSICFLWVLPLETKEQRQSWGPRVVSHINWLVFMLEVSLKIVLIQGRNANTVDECGNGINCFV